MAYEKHVSFNFWIDEAEKEYCVDRTSNGDITLQNWLDIKEWVDRTVKEFDSESNI